MGNRGIALSAIVLIVAVAATSAAAAGYFFVLEDSGPSGGPAENQVTENQEMPGGENEVTDNEVTTQISVYSGASETSIPSQMKTGLGITSDVTCKGYTVSAGAEEVMDCGLV